MIRYSSFFSVPLYHPSIPCCQGLLAVVSIDIFSVIAHEFTMSRYWGSGAF